MKIGVIADIHGNAPALKAVLSVLHERVDQILFLGDIAGYYPFVNECAEMWDSETIVGVRGNHDEVLIQCISHSKAPGPTYNASYGTALERSCKSLSKRAGDLVKSLPCQQRLTLSSVSISMFHGAPWDALEGRVYPDFVDWQRFAACPDDVVLLGNTHYPLVKRWKGKLVLNPGSVGQPRDRSGGACYAELDLVSAEVVHHRITYDASTIIQDVLQHDPDTPYLAEVLTR